MKSIVGTLIIHGKEYVVVPKAEYLHATELPESVGAALRSARKAVRLTQAALAKRLGVSQAMVAGAESGRIKVGEDYARGVLKACRLPVWWGVPAIPR